MPSLKNQNQLKELKQAIAESKAVIISNYAGMSVSAQNQLRSAISETGGTFSVAKNTLIRLALKDRLPELSDDLLKATEGPSAILTTPIDDPVSPTKALFGFIKDNETPVVKIGVLDDKVLSPSEIEALSKLPGRTQLLGMLAGQLNAPISSFAQVLRVNLQNVVYALTAIKDQKENNQN